MDDHIEISQWWQQGQMMYNRDYLPINHPEHTYNYIKRLGKTPEHYGIYHPLKMKYDHLSKDELISKIIELESTIQYYEGAI